MVQILNERHADTLRKVMSHNNQPAEDAAFISIDRRGTDVRIRHGNEYCVERLGFDFVRPSSFCLNREGGGIVPFSEFSMRGERDCAMLSCVTLCFWKAKSSLIWLSSNATDIGASSALAILHRTKKLPLSLETPPGGGGGGADE